MQSVERNPGTASKIEDNAPTVDKSENAEQRKGAALDTPVTSKRLAAEARFKTRAGRPPTAARWEGLKERANSWHGTAEDIRGFFQKGDRGEEEETERGGKRKVRDSPGEGPHKGSKIAFIHTGRDSPWFKKSTKTPRTPPRGEYGKG